MELLRFPLHRGFSVRSIVTFVLAVIVTALLWTTLSTTATHAAGTATWQSGSTILFDNHGYTAAQDFTDTTGTIPAGSTIYRSPLQTSDSSSVSPKIFVLYFTPGVDPPTATSANYVEFDYKDNKTSNSQNKQTVTATPQDASGNSGSSCSVSGVGWIICPASEFMADAMDNMFGILAGMIAVKPPVLGDTNNSMYVAWNIMRSIANVAFVIVFLVIIYAQLANVAISNYGLKKLIPRLIVAAVLVNLSFFIAALAIDVSNILGYSVQQVFNTIREQTFHLTNDNVSGFNTNTWGAVTAAVLAGGGVVGGFYYMAAGGPFLLVSILIGLLLTVLFVVVILAARQAIIVILVIIAPLAFVANLLPNTEKWFEKWKDLFFTMLIFFPAFSLVFGGSQLAGQIIIQNAGDNIATLIFGMAVQIAPLVITPLILKLSGGLLGRIAQIANNPRKGLIDRSRNWGERRAEHAKQQNMARGARWYNPASYGSGMVRRMDYRKRRLSDNTDIWKQEATNRYEQTPQYGGKPGNQRSVERSINARKAVAELDKGRIHDEHASHIEHLKGSHGVGTRIHSAAMAAQVGKDTLETSQQQTTAYYNQQRVTNGTALNTSMNSLETNKTLTDVSEQNKAAYLNEQRTYRVTQLGAAAERLEAAKLNAEGWQNNYTAHIDGLKLANAPGIGEAARFALSSKDLAEAAQNRVQTVFDRERATAGEVLNTTTVEVERTKITAEGAKSQLTEYISTAKTTGGALHIEFMETERLKQVQQIADSRLTRVVDEYKSGALDAAGLTPAEQALMERMALNTEEIAAEAQGGQAAKNMQTKRIAEAFTETVTDPTTGNEVRSARAEGLLNIAKSVDEYGDVRAEANALSTLEDITNKARTANESLIEERAVNSNETPKNYALQLLRDRLADPNAHSEDIIRAAMEIAGKEAQIPIIRDMRKSTNFNQDHLTAMLLRNSGTMKAKGGFDLQNDTGLVHASDELMDASIAGTLGSTSAEQFKDLKNGAIISYSDNMDTIMEHTAQMEASSDPKENKYGRGGVEGIQKTYFNLTLALRDPQMVRALGDNLIPAIKMHRKIHANPRFHNDAMLVDYGAIDPQNLSADPRNVGDGLPGSA